MGTFLGYPQTASAKNLTMDYLQNLKARFFKPAKNKCKSNADILTKDSPERDR
jgi:hypothetical protein